MQRSAQSPSEPPTARRTPDRAGHAPRRRAPRRIATTALVLALPLSAVATTAAPASAAPGKARTTLTLKAPSTAWTSSKVTLSGKATTRSVAGSKRRTIRVEVRKNGRWKRVTTRRTDASGRYSIKVGTPAKATTRRYRVTVLSTAKRASAKQARTVTIAKAPPAPQRPTPSPADFRTKWDTTSRVAAAGATFTTTGTVPGPTGRNRKVVLQSKHTDQWHTVARGTTDAQGRYTLSAPADWLVNLQHRVYVPKNSKGRMRFSQATRLRATPSWNPQGVANDWAPLTTADGRSYRWNACAGPIRYRVNSALAPDFVTPEFVKKVVSEVALATGLTFTYQGSTTAHAFPRDNKSWPGDTDLVISWSTNDQTSSPITGNAIQGRGGVAGHDGVDARGNIINVTEGHVLLRPDSRFLANETATFGVLKHELGHAVGLAHSPSENGEQLMDAYFAPVRGTEWGSGDLTGLRRHGITSGCVLSWTFASGTVSAPPPSGLLPLDGNAAEGTESGQSDPDLLNGEETTRGQNPEEQEYTGRLHTASLP